MEALAELRRAASVLCAFETEIERFCEKVHEECFAQTVDGAPSTAPSKISAEQRLIITPLHFFRLWLAKNSFLTSSVRWFRLEMSRSLS